MLPAVGAFVAMEASGALPVGRVRPSVLHLRGYACAVAGIGHGRAIFFRVAISCRKAVSPAPSPTASFMSAPRVAVWSECPGGRSGCNTSTPRAPDSVSVRGEWLPHAFLHLVGRALRSTCLFSWIAFATLTRGTRLSCFVLLARRLGDGPGGELLDQIGDGGDPQASRGNA